MTHDLPPVAVVLPTWNEADQIGRVLASLSRQTVRPAHVVVVDGGSTDHTVSLARQAGAEVIEVAEDHRGRGNQIAVGVASLPREFDLVLIAHADMEFPPDAVEAVARAFAAADHLAGGCLGHRFDAPERFFRALEWFNRLRAVWGVPFGDQAQFFRRSALETVGGFPSQPIMEDVELALRLLRLRSFVALERPVRVSARDFRRHGIGGAMIRYAVFLTAYALGGPSACQAIHARYYAHHQMNNHAKISSSHSIPGAS